MAYEPHTWLTSFGPGYNFLSKGERRAISDFVLLWSLYEAQVLECNASAPRMVSKIDNWEQLDSLDLEKIESAWDHFYARLIENGETSYRFDSLNLTVANAVFVREQLLNPVITIGDRHRVLAYIVHRIRNNLLHGEKWSYGLADQELNFKCASHLLMVWMDLHKVHG